jgi:serine protease Do
MTGRKIVGGVTLVALGAAGTFAATHLKVSWGPAAEAAPVVVAEAKSALPPPSPAQVSDARMLGRTFAQVASQVGPSVVSIQMTKVQKMPRGMTGNPFRFFFGPGPGSPFGGDDDDDDAPQMPGRKQRGAGSGVVIDARGYILTNNHVAGDADELKVTFQDGKTLPAKVVGADPRTDLAVIKVEPGDYKLKAATLGDSEKVQVGEFVMAIGNPFGLDHTVTIGVLSAKNRGGLGKTQYEDFLQTDASINPGNSGGPLVNVDGEVIGINTAILGPGGNIGIGFAVPSSMAKPIADQLIANGKVRRPYLGILMQDLTPELAKSMGKAPEKGAIVSNIQPGSPADKAGVKPGDVIVAVDGQPVDGSKAVQRTVLTKKIGQKVDVQVWRDGKEVKLAATTSELPDDANAKGGPQGGRDKESPKAKLGIGLQTLTPDLAERLGVGRGVKGAVIASVREGSPAQEAGLREGDVIVEVDRRAVTSADDAVKALRAERTGGHLVRVQRGEGALYVTLP